MDSELFLAALRSRVHVPDDEFGEYIGMADTRHYSKNELLLKQGEIPRYSNFIAKGCVRTYYVGNDGTERTTLFTEEGYWIGDLENMRTIRLHHSMYRLWKTPMSLFFRGKSGNMHMTSSTG